MLLAHPEAEDLGRFVEGTLDDPERNAIVQHIADCDECRVLVVDAAEFIEPAKVERRSNWWMRVAASLMLVAVIGTLSYRQFRDPEVPLIKASSHLHARLTEERLAGFSYVDLHRMRSAEAEKEDGPAASQLDLEIADVLDRRDNNAKTLHAKGIAHLLLASRLTEVDAIKAERADAVAALQAAVDRAPENAAYQTDLAAALLATGNRDLALSHLKKALAIDPRNPEALFNQAIALRDSDPKAAIAASKSYLDVDSSSPWAKEIQQNLENLQDSL